MADYLTVVNKRTISSKLLGLAKIVAITSLAYAGITVSPIMKNQSCLNSSFGKAKALIEQGKMEEALTQFKEASAKKVFSKQDEILAKQNELQSLIVDKKRKELGNFISREDYAGGIAFLRSSQTTSVLSPAALTNLESRLQIIHPTNILARLSSQKSNLPFPKRFQMLLAADKGFEFLADAPARIKLQETIASAHLDNIMASYSVAPQATMVAIADFKKYLANQKSETKIDEVKLNEFYANTTSNLFAKIESDKISFPDVRTSLVGVISLAFLVSDFKSVEKFTLQLNQGIFEKYLVKLASANDKKDAPLKILDNLTILNNDYSLGKEEDIFLAYISIAQNSQDFDTSKSLLTQALSRFYFMPKKYQVAGERLASAYLDLTKRFPQSPDNVLFASTAKAIYSSIGSTNLSANINLLDFLPSSSTNTPQACVTTNLLENIATNTLVAKESDSQLREKIGALLIGANDALDLKNPVLAKCQYDKARGLYITLKEPNPILKERLNSTLKKYLDQLPYTPSN